MFVIFVLSDSTGTTVRIMLTLFALGLVQLLAHEHRVYQQRYHGYRNIQQTNIP